MLFLGVLRGVKINMIKYTKIERKGKNKAIISDKTGYRRTERLIYKDKVGEYVIIDNKKVRL